jgi:unsaturated rhamnogalacturonyl hydrolase
MKQFYRLLHWKSTLLIGGVLFLFMVLNKVRAQQPVPYSVAMAESIMNTSPGGYGGWNYVSGTVLRGFIEVWKITGEKKYFDYIRNTVDRAVNADGSINQYRLSDYNIDQIKEGCAVLFLYRETGEAKYKTAAELLRRQLKEQPRTSEGAFWHKKRYPWQIWLDGLYMGCPFLAEYGAVFNEPAAYDDVINQLLLTHKHTLDPVTGLYYHGWDEKREQEWADSVTGQSPSFWGRAMGWYAMALVDALDYIPPDHAKRDSVLMVLNSFSATIRNYQDSASGVWWQGNREGNYLESSASCMFVYALAKAVRKGYIEPSYHIAAVQGFRGILKNFIATDTSNNLVLGRCCLTAGLGYGRDGSYDYYVNKTDIAVNDGKATGPFILAALEIENSMVPVAGSKQNAVDIENVRPECPKNSGNITGNNH